MTARIEEIYVDGYGHLHDVTIRLGPGLVCVHGANEAGKSTLLSFIRSVLFGFKDALTELAPGVDRRTAPYDPVSGGTKGGQLVLVQANGGAEKRYRVERRKTGRRIDGELVVEDLDAGRRESGESAERMLAAVLGGAKADVFAHLFAVGPDELHTLSSLARDEVRSVLFTADAGVGPGFVTALRSLKEAESELFKSTGRKPVVNALIKRRKDLRAEIRGAERDLAGYEAERTRLADLDEETDRLESEQEKHTAAVERAKVRVQVREVLAERAELAARLQALEKEQLPDEATMGRVARLLERMEALDEDMKRLGDEIVGLQEEREKVRFDPNDAAAWPILAELPRMHLAEDLAAFNESGELVQARDALPKPHLEKAQREHVQRLVTERGSAQEKAAVLKEDEARLQAKTTQARGAMLDAAAVAAAQSALGADIDALQEDVARADEAHKAQERRVDALLAELGPGWDRDRLRAVPADRETRARVMALLPSGAPDARAAPGGPVWLLPTAGGALILIAIALLVARLLDPPLVTLLIAGGILLFVLAGLRRGRRIEQDRSDPPPESRQALLEYGIEDVVTQAGFQAIAEGVADARRELREEDEARERLARAERRRDDAQARLAAAAQGVGVPAERPVVLRAALRRRLDEENERVARLRADELTLEGYAEQATNALSEAARADAELKRIVAECRAGDEEGLGSLVTASSERDDIENRLAVLATQTKRFAAFEAGLAAVQVARDASPLPREGLVAAVAQLAATLEKAHADRARSERLQEQIAERSLVQKAKAAERERAAQELEAVLRRHAVADADALAVLRSRAHSFAALRQEVEGLEKTLRALESGQPGVRDEAQRVAPEEDAVLLAEAEEHRLRVQEALRAAREENRSLNSKLDRLDSSDRLGALLAEDRAVDAELEEAREAWAVHAITRFLLERARAEYEEKHGPRVLKRAGEFLHQVTSGRYERVVADPESGGYVLVTAAGRRVPAAPPHVSRGTFAQLYLLVRLAYTDIMGEQASLPYVLDDVLSDFDETRLKATCGVLKEVAARRQVVVFTHHAHVAAAIEQAGGSVVPLAV